MSNVELRVLFESFSLVLETVLFKLLARSLRRRDDVFVELSLTAAAASFTHELEFLTSSLLKLDASNPAQDATQLSTIERFAKLMLVFTVTTGVAFAVVVVPLGVVVIIVPLVVLVVVLDVVELRVVVFVVVKLTVVVVVVVLLVVLVVEVALVVFAVVVEVVEVVVVVVVTSTSFTSAM
jgi:hypothetical protein